MSLSALVCCDLLFGVACIGFTALAYHVSVYLDTLQAIKRRKEVREEWARYCDSCGNRF